MTETLPRLLLRLSEAGNPAILWGRQAKPYLGREFDRLLDRGLLVEQAPADEWDVCPDCECGLDQRPIQRIDGILVAACPFDHAKDVRLEPEDVRSFKIDCGALIQEIARESGFENPSEVAPGVWHLGATVSQRPLFLALLREAVLQLGLIGAVRSFSGSSPTTVISPNVSAADKTRFAEAGVLLVCAQECLAGDGAAGGFAIDFSKLDPSPRVVPRLVIRRSAKTVALDEATKNLSEQAFQLLVLLAEHAMKSPAILENRRIETHLWGANIHRISSQVREPVRALRDALAADSANSEEVRALIENRRNPNGYRLVLAPEDIKLTS